MYCKKCGTEIAEYQKFCKKCGNKLETEPVSHDIQDEMKTYSLVLVESELENLEIANLIREITGGSLSDAVNKVEKIPSVIINNIGKEEADSIKKRFEEIGAKVECKLYEADTADAKEEIKDGKTEYVFLKQYGHRKKLERIVTWAENIIGIIFVIMLIYFVYEQIRLGEEYKIAIYILRGCVYLAPVWIPLCGVYYLGRILEYKESDLKEKTSPSILLLANVMALVFWIAATVPFLGVSDLDKAGWVMLIGFGEITDLLGHFKWTIMFIVMAVATTCCTNYLMKNEETGDI